MTLKAKAKTLFISALKAVANLIRSKLFPKAVAKYCKALQDASEAVIDKADELLDKIAGEPEGSKKRIKYTYMLLLIKNTLSSLGEIMVSTANAIDIKVDFEIIENTEANDVIKEATDKAQAEEDEQYDELIASLDTPHCDDDGCVVV